MPVSRTTPGDVGAELVRLYGELERVLAAGVARRLARGMSAQDWLSSKLAAAGELRRWAEKQVARAARQAKREAEGAVSESARRGRAAADRDLPSRRDIVKALPQTRTIDVLARGLVGKLEAMGPNVVRSVVDAYRTAATAGAAGVLGGAETRRQATQRAWNALLDRGFTAFTDARGRQWSLSGYVEMAMRTTTAQAAVQGQLERQAELGLDLVIVSNAPQECEKCRPWEGKILTRDERGRGGTTLEVEHTTEDRNVPVRVAGSVDEAIRAGLLHPNCRHSLSAYLPGITEVPTHTADPEGDAARQKLRALERAVRKAKLREAGALDEQAKAKAGALVRQRQAAIRQHVADNEHLGVFRKPERERLDLGLKRERAATAPAPRKAAPRKAAPPAGPRKAATPSRAPEPAPAPPPAPAAPRASYQGPIDARLDAAETATVRKALDRQAGIVPQMVKGLKGVERATPEDMAKLPPGAAAFYRVGERKIYIPEGSLGPEMHRSGLNCLESGWWSKCRTEDAGPGHILAHEFGHHVHRVGMSGLGNSADVLKLWDTLASELGIPAPPRMDAGPYGTMLAQARFAQWFESHKAVFKREISIYGGTNEGECMAEIWAEYSNMGAAARPLIRKIGDMMRAIAERNPGR